jgi:hypothetical protein
MKFTNDDIVLLADGRIGQIEEEIYTDRYRVYVIQDYAICHVNELTYLCKIGELANKVLARLYGLN